jgi:TPR repeat protein
MTCTQGSNNGYFAVRALIFGGFLLLASSVASRVFAAPNGGSDVPSLKAPPEPRSVEEQIRLADDYLVGRGVAQDSKQSAYWYEKAANAGDPDAQMQIGYLYGAGIGVAKDPVRAAHWYRLAASGGSIGAKVDLGILYLWGTGVNKDEHVAAQLFREAVNRGSGLAACFLGDMYYLGLGVAQDKAAGERWYVRGVELRDPRAEYDLGLLLFDAKDHIHDFPAAATLLRKSAAAGDVPAMYTLGLLLVRNPALATSPQEAATLLNDSAKAGMWKASMLLGVLARDGTGGPADDGAAYYQFRVAALQGGTDVSKLLENDLRLLAAKLGDSRSSALDSQAEDWYRQHHFVLEFVYKEGQSRTRFPAYALALPENGMHAMQFVPAIPN